MNERAIIEFLSILAGQRVQSTTSSSGWVQAPCPFARWKHAGGTDSNPSFGVKIDAHGPSGFNCMTCGQAGPRLHLLSWRLGVLEGRTLDAANLYLAQHESKDFDISAIIAGEQKKQRRIKDPIAFMMGFDTQGSDSLMNMVQQDLMAQADMDWSAVQDPPRPRIAEDRMGTYADVYHHYLSKRGISEQTSQRWGLRVEKNRIGDRIVFPVRDVDGHLLAYSKRTTWDAPVCPRCGYRDPEGTAKEDRTIVFGTRYKSTSGKGGCPRCRAWVWPKYQHSKGFRRNFYLYGEHLVDRSHRVGVLTEGNLNPIRLSQVGVRNALATFGAKGGTGLPDINTGTPGEQLYQAAKLFDTIVMFGDGDLAGREWAEKNTKFFRTYFPSHTLHSIQAPEGLDPADNRLSDRDVIELINDFDVFCG